VFPEFFIDDYDFLKLPKPIRFAKHFRGFAPFVPTFSRSFEEKSQKKKKFY